MLTKFPKPFHATDFLYWMGWKRTTHVPLPTCGVTTRRLYAENARALEAYLYANTTLDEAMFFLDPLKRHGLHGSHAIFFGGFDSTATLQGVMVVKDNACHTVWSDPSVLPLFATILQRDYPQGCIRGLRQFVEPFVAHFSSAAFASQQQSTMCELTARSMHSVPPRHTRRATLDDVATLVALEQRVAAHDHGTPPDLATRQATIAERILHYTVYMAEANGQAVAVAYTDTEMLPVAHVCDVATDPDYRNQGFGTACVAALCRDLLLRVTSIFLTYADGHAAAARACEKIGFVPCAQRQHAVLHGSTPRQGFLTAA